MTEQESWGLVFGALSLAASGHASASEPQVLIESQKAPVYKILNDKGEAQLLMNEGTGAKEASLDRLILRAGAEIPEHVHENSAEYLYVETGTIQLAVGGKVLVAQGGDAVYIP